MSEPSSSSRSADEDAIRALYQQLLDGWNNGSGEAFAAPFAEDGDLVGFDGTHLRKQHHFISNSDTFVRGSWLIGKVRSVRFLTPDVAVMHAVGGTIMAGQSDIEPERNSVQTLVAMNDSRGEWYLAAFQNTRAQYLGDLNNPKI